MKTLLADLVHAASDSPAQAVLGSKLVQPLLSLAIPGIYLACRFGCTCSTPSSPSSSWSSSSSTSPRCSSSSASRQCPTCPPPPRRHCSLGSKDKEKKLDPEKELLLLNSKIERLLNQLDKEPQQPALSEDEECVVCVSSKATIQTAPCCHRVLCQRCFIKTIQVAVAKKQLPLTCVMCRARVISLRHSHTTAWPRPAQPRLAPWPRPPQPRQLHPPRLGPNWSGAPKLGISWSPAPKLGSNPQHCAGCVNRDGLRRSTSLLGTSDQVEKGLAVRRTSTFHKFSYNSLSKFQNPLSFGFTKKENTLKPRTGSLHATAATTGGNNSSKLSEKFQRRPASESDAYRPLLDDLTLEDDLQEDGAVEDATVEDLLLLPENEDDSSSVFN